MDLKLTLFNSLGKQKEPFTPLKGRHVSVYSCGPTVYDNAHIGNFRYFIFVDTLIRTLKYNGFHVKHVLNITDVGHLTDDQDKGEDKIEKAARTLKQDARKLSELYTKMFLSDSKKLNILSPDELPRATHHIQEQIKMIQTLEKKGYTYTTTDGVYFDTSKIKEYGKLIGLDAEKLKDGARVEKNPEKKNPTDFALWKLSRKDEKRQMEWHSPWGVGFPGWHIECSAMSLKYLGFPFDIHTGGIDHMPVHHTNEIAQNESCFGGDTVRLWMHSEFITVEGQKMSKSLKNTFTISDIEEKGFNTLSFRYLVLNAHYKQLMNFTWEALGGAANAYEHLLDEVKRLSEKIPGGPLRSLKNLFRKSSPNLKWSKKLKNAINDDLNTPLALSVLWDLLKDTTLPYEEKLSTILSFDEVLGLDLKKATKKEKIPETVLKLAEEREAFRKSGNWEAADRLRDQINKKGYNIEDTEGGYRISKNF